ncbi:DUF2752 domain-containing protein [Bremerella alba]|uniref:DUF2752 domain-containing protein n=1 Tax=Bremerella alba TaxID=980252 RepID=A0A7V8V9K5_9BACT|nr:DUF2752 domain-containing protein [Bremerella alba]MBA2117406.1 hypothetical protein [Bremerella alba]
MSSSVVMPLDSDVPRPKWSFHIIMLSMAVVVTILSFVLYTDGPHDVVIPGLNLALPPTCSMQNMAGIDCPGCGLTRSFISIAHGKLDASLAFNPAGILIFGVVLFQIPYRIAQLWRIRRGLPAWNLNSASLWIWGLIGIVLMVQWIGKLV